MVGEVSANATVTRVLLRGELDLITVPELRSLLAVAEDHATRRVLVDVTDVAFLDVLSFSAILATADAVERRGARLEVRGARSAVQRLFRLFNAADLLVPSVPAQRTAAAAS